MKLTNEECRAARLSRDHRFDGVFFVAVKTTGIFCRPICPATPPKEENVEYYSSAAKALIRGYRPCLRCRPDSAPHSWAWKGSETSFQRALTLIEQGALEGGSVEQLSERLGISSRYLRKLFDAHLGVSPKQLALLNQLMFAKQLLHSSTMSVQDIGYACGFNSIRRFNDAFMKTLKLNPSQVRRGNQAQPNGCSLRLAYRGAYDWQRLLDFYRLRAIKGIETVTADSYQRVVDIDGSSGWFKIYADKEHCQSVVVEFELQDVTKLKQPVTRIRRMFDLDSDVTMIESQLSAVDPMLIRYPGIRIPGVWSVWEAGVRAVLGQQVSVKLAISQLNLLVETLAGPRGESGVFPSPTRVASADLSFLRMPESRKQTLSRLAQHLVDHPEGEVESWLALKGIGPWTVNYVSLRGQSQANLFLDTDLIVKKYTKQTPGLTVQRVSPWGSYATLHCWSHF